MLSHFYQDEEIQDIADFVGDSLDLSKNAAKTNADVIVEVRFMAVAKILSPNKTVVGYKCWLFTRRIVQG